MIKQSEAEKEFYSKNNEKSNFDSSKLSDREIQEKQLELLKSIEKSNLRIQSNVVFFYYAFASSIAIALIILGAN